MAKKNRKRAAKPVPKPPNANDALSNSAQTPLESATEQVALNTSDFKQRKQKRK